MSFSTYDEISKVLDDYGVGSVPSLVDSVKEALRTVATATQFVVFRDNEEVTAKTARIIQFVPFIRTQFITCLESLLKRCGYSDWREKTVMIAQSLYEVWSDQYHFETPPKFYLCLETIADDNGFSSFNVFRTDEFLDALTLFSYILPHINDGSIFGLKSKAAVLGRLKWKPNVLTWYRLINTDVQPGLTFDNTKLKTSQWLYDKDGKPIDFIPEAWMVNLGMLEG